ncbi:MAG: DNA mismatch repair protein MutS [Firmicutes bacterium]|nr:DNA mismatch repair protein MutS [Bacillota bacterium]
MPITPMMQRFLDLKEQYKDCLLFYRLGDFYELFFEDAKVASRELGLALTGRQCGLADRAPMCGVPHHAAQTYIKRLIDKGYSVGICEQLTQATKGKGLVERDVVKIITPGTYSDETFLDSTKNNFVAAVYMDKKEKAGAISWADITTGQFCTTQITGDFKNFLDTLFLINPREIISTTKFKVEQKKDQIASMLPTAKDYYDYSFDGASALETMKKYFKIKTTTIFDIQETSPMVNSCGALLEYLLHTQKQALSNIEKIQVIQTKDALVIDKVARDHLEITHQFRDPLNKIGSLLHTIDHTKTPMGARLLSSVITRPLIDLARINQRLDAVDSLVTDKTVQKEIRTTLGKISDIPRLTGRVAAREIMPRDMHMLATSLDNITTLKEQLGKFDRGLLKVIHDNLTPMDDITKVIRKAIMENPPAKLDDGGYIKKGFNAELDELNQAQNMGKVWVSKLEEQERKECDLKELKIGYNRISGYYFEIPKRLADRIPYRMTRHGNTINTERYITPELKQLEEKIVNAETLAQALEQKILGEIRMFLTNHISTFIHNAEQIAILDVVANFAYVAIANRYVRPKMNTTGELVIHGARHPVLENIIGYSNFISNDCMFVSPKITTKIITGPNMAGKSTYMKTIALNVILAHAGSFVAANMATIPTMDRIFTRIGASDSLLAGQSTFMTELNQICTLLHNATKNSLLLIDELGRGTGTQEGKAIASATISYVTDKIGCMSMFATHFHELAALADDNSKIKNYRATTSVIDGNIVFLHKILPGKEEHSFGIEVAKMAGLPKEVLDNAKKLYEIDKATQQQLSGKNVGPLIMEKEVLIENPVVSKLQEININNLSPMEALVMLGDLVKESKND